MSCVEQLWLGLREPVKERMLFNVHVHCLAHLGDQLQIYFLSLNFSSKLKCNSGHGAE